MTTLMPIGGNINAKQPVVLEAFLQRAGGSAAHIVILPQTSALADTGEQLARLFLELGARTTRSLDFRTRAEANATTWEAALREATGIFISGGNQMRLPALISGTPFAAALQAAYRAGIIIAGTSAGAAVLSKIMIGYGKGGPTPRAGLAQYMPGLGLTETLVFDQHFRQRDRLGRLLYLIAAAPGTLGVGIDEDTAAIVENDALLTVVGTGAVTLVDGHEIEASTVAETEGHAVVAVSNIRLHVLTAGCCYKMPELRAVIPIQPLLRD